MRRRSLLLLFLFFFFFFRCNEEEKEPIYDEGKLVVGTEFVSDGQSYGVDWEPDMSLDSRFVIYTARNGTGTMWLTLVNVESGEKSFLLKGGFNPAWSPDGNWVVFNVNSSIYKIKKNSDSLTLLASEGSNFSPDWSSDGSKIIYDRSINDSYGPSGTWIMDKTGSNKEYILPMSFPKFFPDDERVLGLKGYGNQIKIPIYNIKTGAEEIILEPPSRQSSRHPELSEDGKRVVFWDENGIWVMNTDGTVLRNVLPVKQIFKVPKNDQLGFITGSSPSWHPDGKHIVYQHLRITDYDEPTGLSFGPWYEGVMSLRLLKVE